MSFYKTGTSWGFSVGNTILFSWEWGSYITLDCYTRKNCYGVAYNFKSWREADIHIKVTPPWREVERPKRFEFRRSSAVMTF